jgi:hypothetical protein
MQEFHFTIQHGKFAANVIVSGECSLYKLAAFITETVGFAFDHAFEFCDNLDNPYQSTERYTLFADMGEGEEGDRSVKKTRISAVFTAGRQMVFHFDYGDDWFFLITCTAVKDSTAQRAFKKLVSTRGKPPEQYPDGEE